MRFAEVEPVRSRFVEIQAMDAAIRDMRASLDTLGKYVSGAPVGAAAMCENGLRADSRRHSGNGAVSLRPAPSRPPCSVKTAW